MSVVPIPCEPHSVAHPTCSCVFRLVRLFLSNVEQAFVSPAREHLSVALRSFGHLNGWVKVEGSARVQDHERLCKAGKPIKQGDLQGARALAILFDAAAR